jgi:hypothetical protein
VVWFSRRSVGMSSSANRGGAAEVSSNARLDADAAAHWMQQREAVLAENNARRERRNTCLRDSAIAGTCAGTVGGLAMYRYVNRRSAKLQNFMGSGGKAFNVVFSFFMPYMFVSNVVRWRCQSQGLKKYEPPSIDSQS